MLFSYSQKPGRSLWAQMQQTFLQVFVTFCIPYTAALPGDPQLLGRCDSSQPTARGGGRPHADLLLVDGNTLENINLVADPARNFVVIMKDGKVHKNLLNQQTAEPHTQSSATAQPRQR